MKEIKMMIMAAIFSPILMMGQDKVGIGVTNPKEKLEVAGKVFSNQGGFKFPDNTVQTTAAYNTQTSDAALPKLLGLIWIDGILGPWTWTLTLKDGGTIPDLNNLIPVYAHSLEVSNVGTANFSHLHITSDISIASPDLFEFVISGAPLPSATLYLLEDGAGSELVYSTIELTGTNITLYSQDQIYQGDFQYAHLNSFAFDFDKIKITVYTATGSSTYCWDRIGNGPC